MRRETPRLAFLAAAWALSLTGALSGCTRTAPQKSAAESEPLPAHDGLRSRREFAAIEDARERGIALIEELGKVLTHPRCVNCHPAGRRPLQEDGLPHQPFVVGVNAGRGAAGLPCGACHGQANYLNVPGNPNWHLAPSSMAWEGRTLAQICAQLKDRSRNGDKSLEELIVHAKRDGLVGYGWNPPEHLEKAPGDQALFGELFEAWVRAGAPCPG